MTREEICKLLTNYGHSPAKALEIAIDVERGDDFSIRWVNLVERVLKIEQMLLIINRRGTTDEHITTH